MGFISKYLLPREIDFNTCLHEQAQIAQSMVETLYTACINNDKNALQLITGLSQQAREIKSHNMEQLLDVFIAPYDKESIFRMIVQLDWVTLSVKHFQLETQVYQLHSLSEYESILKVVLNMANSLEQGIRELSSKNIKLIAGKIEQVRDQYNEVVEHCARATAELLQQDDYKRIIRHKDMLLQLKEIAKRIHVSTNTLEDMALKVA